MNATRAWFFVGVLSSGFAFLSARAADDSPKPDGGSAPEPTEMQMDFMSKQNKPLHYSGKLVALTPQEIATLSDPQVIAKLVSDETMFVKPDGESVKAVLMTYIGKDLTVNGHRRADGKFLNVLSVVPQLTASPTPPWSPDHGL